MKKREPFFTIGQKSLMPAFRGMGCSCGEEHGWPEPQHAVERTQGYRRRAGSRRNKRLQRQFRWDNAKQDSQP